MWQKVETQELIFPTAYDSLPIDKSYLTVSNTEMPFFFETSAIFIVISVDPKSIAAKTLYLGTFHHSFLQFCINFIIHKT